MMHRQCRTLNKRGASPRGGVLLYGFFSPIGAYALDDAGTARAACYTGTNRNCIYT